MGEGGRSPGVSKWTDSALLGLGTGFSFFFLDCSFGALDFEALEASEPIMEWGEGVECPGMVAEACRGRSISECGISAGDTAVGFMVASQR